MENKEKSAEEEFDIDPLTSNRQDLNEILPPVGPEGLEILKKESSLVLAQYQQLMPTGVNARYQYHDVIDFKKKDDIEITFELRLGGGSIPLKTATYRVIYMTRPTLGIIPIPGPINPSKPKLGGYGSNVYVLGIKVSGHSDLPTTSPWTSSNDIELNIKG